MIGSGLTHTPTLLFLYEMEKAVFLEEGLTPYTTFSHYTHFFLIAHEARRLGWRVYFRSIAEMRCQEVLQLYPAVQLGGTADFGLDDFQPDMIFCVNTVQVLTTQRKYKPNAIGVYILNAHSWLENTAVTSLDFTEWMRVAVANDIDFILTQNQRMADLGYHLFHLMARFHWRDRILTAPNTFCREVAEVEAAHFDRAAVRRQMNVTEDDIVIINSGGPWSWTDTDTFALAFAEVMREGAQRLKFIQMGVIQNNNIFQTDILPFWQQYINDTQDLMRAGRLTIFTNWQDASGYLPAWNYGADVGLNVSRDTAENYQSHRVRLIDYAKVGLPVFITTGNYYGTYGAYEAVMEIEPGNIESYKAMLWKIERGEIDLGQKRAAMAQFREEIMSEKQIPQTLQHMLQTGRIPENERGELRHLLQQLYQSIAQHNFADNFKAPQHETG